MTIADELWKLDELRRNGAISHDEFELAKRKSLEGSQDAGRSAQLEEIKLQNQIAQLDREWELERENYLVAGRNGYQSIPEKSSCVIGGVFIVAFGIFWTVTSAYSTGFGRDGAIGLFPWLGVFFSIFGGGLSIHAFLKASRYEKARQGYQRKRREMLDKTRTAE